MSDPASQQTVGHGATAASADAVGFRAAARLFSRPQLVTFPMIALALIIPVYLLIGSALMRAHTLHAPAVALDSAIPVDPAWSVIYLSLFLAALLPVFVVHQQALIRRVIFAYLAAWLIAYGFFLAYPTICPRPEQAVAGKDFSSWLLRAIYSADVPCNCFPSLHVAQSFLAAFICYKVHRGIGAAAVVWACLVAASTLYTKQHYVVDVVTGAALGYGAYLAFVRSYARDATPAIERRLAPYLALGAVTTYGLLVAIMWIAYSNGVVIS